MYVLKSPPQGQGESNEAPLSWSLEGDQQDEAGARWSGYWKKER